MAFWSKALWVHRYHKYSHIANARLTVWRHVQRLRRLKTRLNGRPLVAIALSEQLGDIVACEPVIREARRRHPDGHLIWFVRKPYAELVAHHPDLNEHLIEGCPGERARLIGSGVFDVVYNMHLSNRRCPYCPDIPVNPIADQLDITYANYYFKGNLLWVFSQAAGLPPLEDEPRVYVPETSRQRVASLNLPANAIVVHCQSSYAPRDWRVDHWNRLVQFLLDNTTYPVIEVGLKPIIRLSHPRLINLCGQLSILETAEVIRHAQLFIGIDSGPAHLANAVGTDAVLMLGKTADFVEFMPYSGRYKRGEGVQILNWLGHPCEELPYDWVEEAVAKRLNLTRSV